MSEFLDLPPGVNANAPEPGIYRAYFGYPLYAIRKAKVVGSDQMTGKVLIEAISTGHREWISRLGLRD